MNYRSLSDMNAAILGGLHLLPPDIDLIVGIPRSGMIAATFTALLCNVNLTDLDSYVAGRVYTSGRTKAAGMRQDAARRKVLVIDDSINGGTAMAEARQRVENAGTGDEHIFAAVYGSKPSHPQADVVFQIVPWPRMFQWNFMHHKFLADCCIDIDGVLCHDPPRDQNDDGDAYVAFLTAARPLYAFTVPLGRLVTSRLEKYRPQTEAWLADRGIVYKELLMLDLPSAEERRRQRAHGRFKAAVYRDSDAILFIESENRQAQEIATLSGKPVLCLQSHAIVKPVGATRTARQQRRDRLVRPPVEMLKRSAHAVLGPVAVAKLRSLLRRL